MWVSWYTRLQMSSIYLCDLITTLCWVYSVHERCEKWGNGSPTWLHVPRCGAHPPGILDWPSQDCWGPPGMAVNLLLLLLLVGLSVIIAVGRALTIEGLDWEISTMLPSIKDADILSFSFLNFTLRPAFAYPQQYYFLFCSSAWFFWIYSTIWIKLFTILSLNISGLSSLCLTSTCVNWLFEFLDGADLNQFFFFLLKFLP